MNEFDRQTIDAVVRILKRRPSLLFITGAGISADSGVPTYRGIGGLYDVDVTEEGYPIEVMLSGEVMKANPHLTWKYLAQIGEAARGATFNRAHEVIAEMEEHFERVWTLTQNVDGFHRLAGSDNVIEIHGNMRSLSCPSCSWRVMIDDAEDIEIPPVCEKCGTILRPDVVLFGEALPDDALQRLRREMETGFGAVFSVGTSSLFPYIQEPLLHAKRWGAPTIEINPGETPVSHLADYRLPLGAAEALDVIWGEFQKAG